MMKSQVKDCAATPAVERRVAVSNTDTGKDVLEEVKRMVGSQRFDLWFGKDTVCRHENQQVVFHIRNAFAAAAIRSHCQKEIDQAVVKIYGTKLETVFQVDQRRKTKNTSKKQPAQNTEDGENTQDSVVVRVPQTARTTTVPQFKKLDSFLRGTSNDMAYRAVELAIHHSCEINPVYIHGFTGTGKTHLLEGIWCRFKNGNAAGAKHLAVRQPLYLTSTQFVSSFLESIRDNGKSGGNFRDRFRNISVLLLDDIQFLAGKEATQTEFLHILNSCIQHGVQIVLTGDKPLDQLALRNDVISRLEAGLPCCIEMPERELSLQICRQIVAERKLPFDEDICRMVADRYGSTVRYMQGALNRLHAASLTDSGQNMTLPLAETVLSDFPSLNRTQIVTLKDIEKAVCETFNIGRERLQSKTRTKAVTVPRMLAMYLARKYTRAALSEIGDFFGKMSHSSVISAQKRVDQWIAADDKIISVLRRMERKLA